MSTHHDMFDLTRIYIKAIKEDLKHETAVEAFERRDGLDDNWWTKVNSKWVPNEVKYTAGRNVFFKDGLS